MPPCFWAVLLLFFLPEGPPSLASDFSGDGRADIAVFRPAGGLWSVRGSTRAYFGTAGDSPLIGDFDGDRIHEMAVFRPPSGLWAIRQNTRMYFGRTGDRAVVADYDGDGTSDPAVYRKSSGLWAIRGWSRVYFGTSSDIPVPGDYDGDLTSDLAVFRGETGLWAIRKVTRVYFGDWSDRPVPADYDGDGRCEVALFRESGGLWAVKNFTRTYFGQVGDLPQVVGDAGWGPAGIGVFRDETGLWALRGTTRVYYGMAGDIPLTSALHWRAWPGSPFGLEIKHFHRDAAHLEKLVEAGAGCTRWSYVSWAEVEPSNTTPAEYFWEAVDEAQLAATGSAGLNLILIIADVPAWAGPQPCGPIDEDFLQDFAEFVGAVVRRYKGPPYNVKYWELFNEPDGTEPEWGAGIGCWGYHGGRYARMLKLAYPAIKAADPEAQLLLGGLAHDWFTDEGGNFYRQFLDDLIVNQGGNYFDIMNFHYYYFHREEWGGSIAGKANHLRNVLAWYGLSKPTVCTEVGIWGYDDEYHLQLQANYVPRVYARGLSAGLERIVWFPLATSTGNSFEGGLLREEDLSPKPAYQVYQVVTRELGDYGCEGPVQTGSGKIEGYRFFSPAAGRIKQVLWNNEEDEELMGFNFNQIRLVGKTGNEQVISDGGVGDRDGTINGWVEIGITSSPVYVETCP